MKTNNLFLLALMLLCASLATAQDKAEAIREKFLNDKDTSILVVSHRGDWRGAPENSLQAMRNCIDMGVDMVEVDLKMTKDGQLVLMHDKLINRTMNGKGHPEDYTLAELKAMRLKNGAGCKTRHTIPTFEELMRLCKGRVMVNVDKGYDYFKQAYEILVKTGTVSQCVMKASLPYSQVKAENGEVLDKMIFMPVVDLQKEDAEAIIDEYIKNLKPKAFELIFAEDTPNVRRLIKKVHNSGSKVFINTLWPELCGGHDDDRAVELGQPEESWGWIISQGTKLIQTDRPQLLLEYLRNNKRHE